MYIRHSSIAYAINFTKVWTLRRSQSLPYFAHGEKGGDFDGRVWEKTKCDISGSCWNVERRLPTSVYFKALGKGGLKEDDVIWSCRCINWLWRCRHIFDVSGYILRRREQIGFILYLELFHLPQMYSLNSKRLIDVLKYQFLAPVGIDCLSHFFFTILCTTIPIQEFSL